MDMGIVNIALKFKYLLIKTKTANATKAIKLAIVTFKASRIPVCRIIPLQEPVIQNEIKNIINTKGNW